MILPNEKFEIIETKISGIQEKVDTGLMNPDLDRESALKTLREIRSSLFSLRGTLRDCFQVTPGPSPDGPRAA